MRMADSEGMVNPQVAGATASADLVMDDDVETESEGLASPVRTPAPQDGNNEPGQHRIEPCSGGEETTLVPEPVIGQTTDPSSIAEQGPSTKDSQVVEAPPQTSMNPRKRRHKEEQGSEIRQAQEGRARKALHVGGDVAVGRRAVAGETADKMVDERERATTQYSLRRRRILTPKASAGKYG
jgi:hypothetical protein